MHNNVIGTAINVRYVCKINNMRSKAAPYSTPEQYLCQRSDIHRFHQMMIEAR